MWAELVNIKALKSTSNLCSIAATGVSCFIIANETEFVLMVIQCKVNRCQHNNTILLILLYDLL